jgi:hypothetical protein
MPGGYIKFIIKKLNDNNNVISYKEFELDYLISSFIHMEVKK